MQTSAPPGVRRAGAAALAAGVLLFASVAAELVHPVQERDGTVAEPATFVLYAMCWVIGSLALVAAIHGMRLSEPADGLRRPRVYVFGRRLSLAGAALLLAWGVVALVTAISTGKPLEASFVLFGLGLLLSMIGNVVLGLSLRRSAFLGHSWALLVVAGAGALVAVTVFVDPWHDVGMFTFDAAWAALGVRLIAAAKGAAGTPTTPPHVQQVG
jgi:hypothetical protein